MLALCALLCNCTPVQDTSRAATALFGALAARGVAASLRTLLLDSPLWDAPPAAPPSAQPVHAVARRVLLDAIYRVTMLPDTPLCADAPTARELLTALVAVWTQWPDEPLVSAEARKALTSLIKARADLLSEWVQPVVALVAGHMPSESCLRAALAYAARRGWGDAAGLRNFDARAAAQKDAKRDVVARRDAAAAVGVQAALTCSLGHFTLSAREETPAGRCDACGATRMAHERRLLCCRRCMRAFYCDAACQRVHWAQHRRACTPHADSA